MLISFLSGLGAAILAGLAVWSFRQPLVDYYAGRKLAVSSYDARKVPVYVEGRLYSDANGNVWYREKDGWSFYAGELFLFGKEPEPTGPLTPFTVPEATG